jgi:hypothetical protein
MRSTSTQEGKSHFSPLTHYGKPTWATPNGGLNHRHEHATTAKACHTSAWFDFHSRSAGMTRRFSSDSKSCLTAALDVSNTSTIPARFIHEQLLNKHSTDNNIPSTSL